MTACCYLLFLSLTLCSLTSSAQHNDEINTITIKKKTVAKPDTGRYSSPEAWDVYPGFPRPVNCATSRRRQPAWYFFAGYEYFKYSYLKVGLHSARERALVTAYGAGIYACFDQETYGLSAFARKKAVSFSTGSIQPGLRAGAYFSPRGSFFTGSPTITYTTDRWCLKRLQLSYAYNFVLASSLRDPENISRNPLPKANTHNLTLAFSLPFYL